MRTGLILAAVMAALIFGSVEAHADTIFAMTGSGGDSSSLYTVDVTTGTATLIGVTGYSHFTGLEWDASTGTLWAVQSDLFDSGDTGLFKVNTSTGAATFVGTTGAQIPDITVGADGVLRGWQEWDGSTADDPVVISKTTGALTKTISGPSTAATGVASLDATHITVKAGAAFYSVDVGTGTSTFLFGMGTQASNILENYMGGYLTGKRTGGDTRWYLVDSTDGSTTTLGLTSDIRFSAVTVRGDTVPEPGSIALLGLGLVGLGIASRRRRARAS